MPLPEAKKTKFNRGASRGSLRPFALEEGTSATAGHPLGPRASVMASASVVEKILVRVILPANREKVEKLSLDQVITQFLHILGQVFVCLLSWL